MEPQCYTELSCLANGATNIPSKSTGGPQSFDSQGQGPGRASILEDYGRRRHDSHPLHLILHYSHRRCQNVHVVLNVRRHRMGRLVLFHHLHWLSHDRQNRRSRR